MNPSGRERECPFCGGLAIQEQAPVYVCLDCLSRFKKDGTRTRKSARPTNLKEFINKMVYAGVRDFMNDHPDVLRGHWISSIAKRIAGQFGASDVRSRLLMYVLCGSSVSAGKSKELLNKISHTDYGEIIKRLGPSDAGQEMRDDNADTGEQE